MSAYRTQGDMAIVIRDRFLDITDRLPRWYELSTRQKVLTCCAALVVAVMAAVTFSVVGGSDSTPSATEAGPGIAPCSRGTSSATNIEALQAAIGDLSPLPHHANLVEVITEPADRGQMIVALVCTLPGTDLADLQDIGSALGRNIQDSHFATRAVDDLSVHDIGDGNDVNTEIVTSLAGHTFTPTPGSTADREAWTVVPSEN